MPPPRSRRVLGTHSTLTLDGNRIAPRTRNNIVIQECQAADNAGSGQFGQPGVDKRRLPAMSIVAQVLVALALEIALAWVVIAVAPERLRVWLLPECRARSLGNLDARKLSDS
jgi:hypothetical protein